MTVTLLMSSDDGGVTYLLRDTFTTARAAGAVNGTAAEPGPGTRTVADVESVIKTQAGRLRGFGQASAAWGDERVLFPAVTRASGRAVQWYVIPEDGGGDIVCGLTASAPSDPRTEGYGFYTKTNQLQSIVEPGRNFDLISNGSRSQRPIEQLHTIVLDDIGAFYLHSTYANYAANADGSVDEIGLTQYPSARVMFATPLGSDATLQPYISAGYGSFGYPNGTVYDDLRVADVPASFMATLKAASDRFTRADSAASLGGSWTADAGTWGISSNQAYLASSSGFVRAWIESGLADCVVQARITVPTPNTVGFGLTLRRTDANNYLRLWNNFSAGALHLQTWVSGGFDGTVYSQGALPMVAGSTYLLTVVMKGNKYKICWDGSWLNSGNWLTDSNSRHLSATKHGLYGTNTAGYTTIRWDDFLVTPLTVTLPAELRTGTVPTTASGGATLGSDTFTDTNGTRLNAHTAEAGGAWTETVGTWTVQSNRATVSLSAGLNHATQSVGTVNVECSIGITTPASFPTNSVRAGVVLRWTDTNNYVYCRLYRDAGTGEIELIENIAGSGNVVHKVALPILTINTTYTLTVRAIGDLIQVLLNGNPELSYITQTGSATGTRCGIGIDSNDDGCTLDNWIVKAL